MTNIILKNSEKNATNRNNFIAKTRDDFKSELLDYASKNFENQIQDFSESSLGGMFLDFASIVGESLTNYVDFQINELNYETATSEFNINNHLKKANIQSGFASPSSVYVDFSCIVAALSENSTEPNPEMLPTILKGTQISSNDGIPFTLEEDVDFTKEFIVTSVLRNNGNNDNITHLFVKKQGLCTSGEVTTETVSFDPTQTSDFLSYTISNENVTNVISIRDNETNNLYFEVEHLTQDTIYKRIENNRNEDYFEVRAAPYRYVLERDFDDGLTTIRFGNGEGKTILDDGLLINPEVLTLPLVGREYFTNFSLDPKKLISSDSLGVSPAGNTLTIKYKYGGGISHNVRSGSINTIDSLLIRFGNTESDNTSSNFDIVKSTMSVNNPENAVGGAEAIDIDELKKQIPLAVKMQSRIVNHEDLIARIYTMPTNFGKIYKAALLPNPFTKISKDLFVICKDIDDNLVSANDAIKVNLSNFINNFRLIGDTFNIVDSPIYNFKIFLKAKIKSNYDVNNVIRQIKNSIIQQMEFKALQIGEGINVNNIIAITLAVPGVMTISSNYKTIVRSYTSFDELQQNSSTQLKDYSENRFSPFENYDNGIVFPPRGGIFELKYLSDVVVISN